jgi:hypothetical protein
MIWYWNGLRWIAAKAASKIIAETGTTAFVPHCRLTNLDFGLRPQSQPSVHPSGSSKTGQEPGPSLLPRHGCRRITVVFRKPALAFSNLSFCQTRNAVRWCGDAIPKILCKLNSLSRTQLQQFCQQCLIACH